MENNYGYEYWVYMSYHMIMYKYANSKLHKVGDKPYNYVNLVSNPLGMTAPPNTEKFPTFAAKNWDLTNMNMGNMYNVTVNPWWSYHERCSKLIELMGLNMILPMNIGLNYIVNGTY